MERKVLCMLVGLAVFFSCIISAEARRNKGAEPVSQDKLRVIVLTDIGGDPDGDKLSYRWFVYKEAGDYPNEITIENANAIEAVVLIPDDTAGREIHVILEVTDNGKPVLYSYRRVIFRVR